MRQALLLALLIAGPAFAKRDVPPAVCPQPVKPVLFLSPLGEPFRPKGDGDDPVKRWFDQADRNHDGTLTAGELMLDGDRFFATLDLDGNGELLPDEMHHYEEDIAPEIRLYQRRPDPGADGDRRRGEEGERRPARPKGGRPPAGGYDGAMGAGRYAFLNIPNPVASADSDYNRAIDRAEFRAAAAARFNDLDPQQTKALTLSQLPKTPAQIAANAACLARIEEQKKKDRSR